MKLSVKSITPDIRLNDRVVQYTIEGDARRTSRDTTATVVIKVSIPTAYWSEQIDQLLERNPDLPYDQAYMIAAEQLLQEGFTTLEKP